ncbi:FtsW/RodA/SpoVE family cell cycle protein, partial [Candidatus Desantisbacteria bacterium]|nr:FtsW/RodA/SpoVE family cell cycle protein [Candidatus Desantisbacteria bacterium]
MIDRRLIKNFDYSLLIAVIFLILTGILIIFSVTSKGDKSLEYFFKQIYWFVFSLIIFFIVLSINYKSFERWSYIFYFLSILLIAGVFLFHPMQGARRWILLGPFRIQPAELAKI